MEKFYQGIYDGNNYRVTVNNCPLTSPHTIEHQCNFSWGCIDHGTRYLAQALLLDLGYANADNLMTDFGLNCLTRLPDNWGYTESELRDLITKSTT
ncbi:MAG: hypothetical protein E6Q32_03295 [Neisseriales bacterium]|jgi:hypothetical protein|nr:MAG: hypothetical protein E6Q32_03295 [Neisseriales bacterium]